MSLLLSLRRMDPHAPLGRILWWEAWRSLAWLWLTIFYRHRCWGINNIPATGPVLLVTNHQSFMDLPMLGSGLGARHFHSMARKTLFGGAGGWLIKSLNAFEVDQQSTRGDLTAMRMGMEKLRQGHMVLVFPEGARTRDGALNKFKKGILVLVRRARPRVLPAAVEGAYNNWPMGQGLPRWKGRTAIIFGEPIEADFLLAMPHEAAAAHLAQRVDQLRLELRRRMRRQTNDRWPPPGGGDEKQQPDPLS